MQRDSRVYEGIPLDAVRAVRVCCNASSTSEVLSGMRVIENASPNGQGLQTRDEPGREAEKQRSGDTEKRRSRGCFDSWLLVGPRKDRN
jgi:hypothetical protein